MFALLKFSILVIIVLVIFHLPIGQSRKDQKIKLKDIETLTFIKGKSTTGRRTRAIPQLQCVGGTARCANLPNSIQCYNKGFDGNDVQWKCEANMRKDYSFGNIEVICEGYDYPEDSYVLVGSCGIEFELNVNKDYDNGYNSYQGSNSYQKQRYEDNTRVDGKSGFSGFIIFAIIGMVLIFVFCLPKNSNRDSASPSAPPPPPGFRSNYMPGNNDEYRSGGDDDDCTRRRTNTSSSGGGGHLFTGLMGAGIGYLLGRNTSTTNQYSTGTRSTLFDDTSSSSYSRDDTSTASTSGFATTRRR